jgi:hypothetical protein
MMNLYFPVHLQGFEARTIAEAKQWIKGNVLNSVFLHIRHDNVNYRHLTSYVISYAVKIYCPACVIRHNVSTG